MPITAIERLAILHRPFPAVTRHTSSYPHAGTLIDRSSLDGSKDLVSMRRKFERGESLATYGLSEVADIFLL